MTQQIQCIECGERFKRFIGKYPGEDVRVESGYARRGFVCDTCGADIDQGDECRAVSVSTPRTPFYEWAGDFIFPMEMPAEGPEHV